MALTSGLAPNVVKTAIDAVFMAEFDYDVRPGGAYATDGLVFMQDSTDRAAVITEQFQGVGYYEARAETEEVPQGTSRVANQKTSSVLNYSKALDISKNFFDDDLHSVVSKNIRDFARLARVTRDRNAFEKYNLGFTTQTTNDGVALFSNSHTTLGGQTVDNLETDTLADASLETAFVSLQEQVTQDGTLGGHEPSCLLVPTQLFKEATVIAKSELVSGSADNDLNYYSQIYPGLQVKNSPFLGSAVGLSGSNTAWFLLSRNHSMMRWERQGIQTALVDWTYQRNNDYIYKAEYREVVDSISYEGIVGSNGTV